MTNDELKNIRQRLGWSRAEMARRLGADLDVINAWEAGADRPHADAINQYHVLALGLEEAASRVTAAPVAETRLEAGNLAQVTRRDLLNEA